MNLTRSLSSISNILKKWLLLPLILLFGACNENFTPTYVQIDGPTIVIGGELVRNAQPGESVEVEITLTADAGLSGLTLDGQPIGTINQGDVFQQLTYTYQVPQNVSQNYDLVFTVTDKLSQTATSRVTIQLNTPVVPNDCDYELKEGVVFITRSMANVFSSGNTYGIENNENVPTLALGDIVVANQGFLMIGRITTLDVTDDFYTIQVSLSDVALTDIFNYLTCSGATEVDHVFEIENTSGDRTSDLNQNMIELAGISPLVNTVTKELSGDNISNRATSSGFSSTFNTASLQFNCFYEFEILIEDGEMKKYVDKLSDCRFTYLSDYSFKSDGTPQGGYGSGAEEDVIGTRSLNIFSSSVGAGEFEITSFFNKSIIFQIRNITQLVSGSLDFNTSLEIGGAYSSAIELDFGTLTQRVNYSSDPSDISQTVNSLSGSGEYLNNHFVYVADQSFLLGFFGIQNYGATNIDETFNASTSNNSTFYTSEIDETQERSFVSPTLFAPFVNGTGVTFEADQADFVLLERPTDIDLQTGADQVGIPLSPLGETFSFNVKDVNDNPVADWGFRIDLPTGIDKMTVIEIVEEGDQTNEIEHPLERAVGGRTTDANEFVILYSRANGVLKYKLKIDEVKFGNFTLTVDDGVSDGGTTIDFELNEQLYQNSILLDLEDPLDKDFDFNAWWSGLSDNSKKGYNLLLGNDNTTVVPSKEQLGSLRTSTNLSYTGTDSQILELGGTEVLGSLTSLTLTSQGLTSIDLTKVATLSILNVSTNSLTSLNISGLTNLGTLNISGNTGLKGLNLSGLSGLYDINISSIVFTDQELKTFLENIDCSVYGKQNFTINLTGTNQNADQTLQISKIKCDSAYATNISSARGMNGQVVYIRGIVTTPDYGSSSGQYYLQDATGGLNIFHSGNNGLTNLGDEIIIKGEIGAFNSTIQIAPELVEVISSNNSLPSPALITSSGLDLESSLQGTRVEIENVYITDLSSWPGNGSDRSFDAVVNGQQLIVRIEGGNNFYDNAPTPNGLFKLTGILGRFRDDVQIFPFNDGDIVLNQTQPSLTTNADLSNFGEVNNGSSSASQSYSLTGSNLIGDVTINAPTGFEVSTDDTNFSSSVTVDQSNVNSTTIHVRFSPSFGTNGEKNGSINHSSAALQNVTVSVTGTETGNAEVVPELFFSEYGEGGSFNKWLEIYNPTNLTIDLSIYSVELYNNGGSGNPNSTENLEGMLAPGETFVLYESRAVDDVSSKGDKVSGVANFNGDDTILLKKNGVVIDAFGQLGFDPGSRWSSNGVQTSDRTLIRKPGILAGDTNENDAFDPSIEWISHPKDTFTFIGQHDISSQ